MGNLISMIYKIVLIRYPFDNLIDYKIRPVVILSFPITKFNHLVTAFISSKIPETLESSDLFISDNQFKLTGLKLASVIRLRRLFTIPQESILKQLGELPSSFHKEIIDKLKLIFNIEN